jgi:hypothetical protein
LSVTAWLFKDTLIRALEAEVDLIADDTVALSEDERTARERAALAQLLDVERGEAALAEQAGELPRPDIDPRAYLGLASTLPAPAQG